MTSKLTFSSILLRLIWVLSLVSLGIFLVALWRGNVDADNVKQLLSSVAGTFYLSCALCCSAASVRLRFWPLKIFFHLGQAIAFTALGLFLVAMWTHFDDLLLLIRVWGIATFITFSFAHMALLTIARGKIWSRILSTLTAVSTWITSACLSWMLWHLRFDDPILWKVTVSCIVVSNVGSMMVFFGHFYAIFTQRRAKHTKDDE